MGKYMFMILFGLFFMAGFVTRASHATNFKGVFEAPMGDEFGQMEGSEGKIGEMGQYKLEIRGVDAGVYDVCLCYYNRLGGEVMEMHLETTEVVDEDTGLGELKSYGGPGSIGDGTFFGPFFKVYNVGCAECAGACSSNPANTLMYESLVQIMSTDS